jgi:AraC-like DNA-binding protein
VEQGNRRSLPSRSIRHASTLGQWELVFSAPDPALRPYVREYVGWWERTKNPLLRREMPTTEVQLILNFGARYRASDPHEPSHWTTHGSFAAGLYDAHTLIGADGPSMGLQVKFTTLGARLFFQRPLADLSNRLTDIDDVLGADGRRLEASLYDAPDWDTRFALCDRDIARRIAGARPPGRPVLWAWRELMNTDGAVPIRHLVQQVGWSERHFASTFREQIGLAPKAFARVLRFARAVEMLRSPAATRLADLAADCGYYDQAHFTRDFRLFAGVTPSELVASRLPDDSGFSAL